MFFVEATQSLWFLVSRVGAADWGCCARLQSDQWEIESCCSLFPYDVVCHLSRSVIAYGDRNSLLLVLWLVKSAIGRGDFG